MNVARPAVGVAEVFAVAPEGWDQLAVAAPGGRVRQGTTWAEHVRARGGEVRFVRFDDGGVALLVISRSRLGSEAFCRHGPVPGSGLSQPGERVAERAVALATWLRDQGEVVSLTVDPVLDASPAYETVIAGAGFGPARELQASIHVMRLDLPAGRTEEALLAGCSKSTRQRIRAAQQAGIAIRDDPAGEWLEAFSGFLVANAERRGFELRPEDGFLGWWRRLLEAGQARLLVAELDSRLLGAMLVHREGGLYSTAFSGDRLESRRELPGTMHALRWAVIRAALADGATAVELGGVDTPGQRQIPRGPGDAGWGLYQHKAGFGAHWVWRTPARRTALRPGMAAAAGLARGALDGLRRLRGRAG
jgi:hypothetical protein